MQTNKLAKLQKKTKKIEKMIKRRDVRGEKAKPRKAKKTQMVVSTSSPLVDEMVYEQKRMKKGHVKHLMNLLDPWGAVNAKLPQVGDSCSNTAKVKSFFNVTANATGKLLMYFDPDFCNSSSSTLTAFIYHNDNSLSGGSVITTSTYSSGGTGSAPIPPSTTVLKTRLVCCGMKITPKVSNLNYVATALACTDYGDYSLSAMSTTALAQPANVQAYTLFSNVMNGNGAVKYNFSNPGQSVVFRWFPIDPISDIYKDAGNYMVDNASKDAGGSARFVVAFQDLPANAPVDVEIVWNIEYLSAPQAKAWLGYTPPAVSDIEHIMVKGEVKAQPQISQNTFPSVGEIVTDVGKFALKKGIEAAISSVL